MTKCSCFSPFRITKIDEGKYTFGESKTVRLLRIHGSSVVVRVGGGWEYLYNFLLKVDPCRAKQHSISPGKQVDAVKLSALCISPLDEKDEILNMSVKRMRKASLPVKGVTKSSSPGNTPGRSPMLSRTSRSAKERVIREVDGDNKGTPLTTKKPPNRRYSLMERQSQYAQPKAMK